jgi:tricorn protease
MAADVRTKPGAFERDFFYDKNLHGLNLAEIKKRYAPYVERRRASQRFELPVHRNAESVDGRPHVHWRRRSIPRPNFVPGGLLGADYKIENGRYRFAKVYNGENWNPNLRAPLTQPGVERQSWRIPAGGGRTQSDGERQHLSIL